MSNKIFKRDYRLFGTEAKNAEEKGLASAEWYTCEIPRKRLKELMQRRDGPAIRDTIIWFVLLILSGTVAYHTWGSWWALPAFAVYGVFYSSAAASRWHECSHGTPFKTRWLNDTVYQVASFMVLREPTPWRWSHTRHHTDTMIVARDPEITVMRPPDLAVLCLNVFSLITGPIEYSKILLHCFGKLTKAERTYIPEMEHNKVFWVARIWLAIYLGVISWAVAIHNILPLMYVGLPSFYGAWFDVLFGFTQHAGLAEDVLDHRLNCRTLYLNPAFRFICWNMNYHVEHHMFPMVPYYSLPVLHEELKNDMPPAYYGLFGAYKEIIPTIFKQLKDPTYFTRRPLPAHARPVSAFAKTMETGFPTKAQD